MREFRDPCEESVQTQASSIEFCESDFVILAGNSSISSPLQPGGIGRQNLEVPQTSQMY